MLWFRPYKHPNKHQRRKMARQRRAWLRRHNKKRKNPITRHHLTNKVAYKMGEKTPWGKDSDENILLLKQNSHRAWHLLFGNRSLEEVAAVLIRLSKLKGRTA